MPGCVDKHNAAERQEMFDGRNFVSDQLKRGVSIVTRADVVPPDGHAISRVCGPLVRFHEIFFRQLSVDECCPTHVVDVLDSLFRWIQCWSIGRYLIMLNSMAAASGGETAIHPAERPAAVRVDDACIRQLVHASEDDHAIRRGVSGRLGRETKHQDEDLLGVVYVGDGALVPTASRLR